MLQWEWKGGISSDKGDSLGASPPPTQQSPLPTAYRAITTWQESQLTASHSSKVSKSLRSHILLTTSDLDFICSFFRERSSHNASRHFHRPTPGCS